MLFCEKKFTVLTKHGPSPGPHGPEHGGAGQGEHALLLHALTRWRGTGHTTTPLVLSYGAPARPHSNVASAGGSDFIIRHFLTRPPIALLPSCTQEINSVSPLIFPQTIDLRFIASLAEPSLTTFPLSLAPKTPNQRERIGEGRRKGRAVERRERENQVDLPSSI